MSDKVASAALPPIVIEAFTPSVITAFHELMQLDAQPVDPPRSLASASAVSVVATMRLERNNPGTMSLIVPLHTARCLAGAYLPPDIELSDDMIDDVVGELANVIAGQAKTILKDTPYHFSLSLPHVTRPPNQKVCRGVVLAFTVMAEVVTLQVDIGNKL